MTKILVTGSRTFNRSDLIWEAFNNFEGHISEIIHGGAMGADSIAQSYAEQHNIPTRIIRPIYPGQGSYYLHRNAEMIALCDEVFAFWDGESRGTAFTIRYAQAREKKVTIIRPDKA